MNWVENNGPNFRYSINIGISLDGKPDKENIWQISLFHKKIYRILEKQISSFNVENSCFYFFLSPFLQKKQYIIFHNNKNTQEPRGKQENLKKAKVVRALKIFIDCLGIFYDFFF